MRCGRDVGGRRVHRQRTRCRDGTRLLRGKIYELSAGEVHEPFRTAKRVTALAKSQHTSANGLLVDLIEAGLHSKEAEKQHYLGLVDKLTAATDPTARQQLKQGLARFTFGE